MTEYRAPYLAETCFEPGHIAGCPGKAGGDHELDDHDDCVPTMHGVGCIYNAPDCPASYVVVPLVNRGTLDAD